MLNIVNTKIGVKLFELSKIYTIMFTSLFFIEKINHSITKSNDKKVFSNLYNLFVIDSILENTSILLAFDIVDSSFISLAKKKFEILIDSLYYDSLVLSEGFVLNDFTLYSAIADSNEKPYENLYRWAKDFGALNKVDLSSHYLNTIRKASI